MEPFERADVDTSEEHAALVAGDIEAIPGRETSDDVLARSRERLMSPRRM